MSVIARTHRLGLLLKSKDRRLSQNIAKMSVITNSKQLTQKKNADSFKDICGDRNYGNSRILPSIRSRDENSSKIRTKADGDSTLLGQRPLSVLPVVYRLWASLRLGHLREWVEEWLPRSVFSLGNGLSSVEAWFSTALDIEEVLSGTGGDQLHVMVC